VDSSIMLGMDGEVPKPKHAIANNKTQNTHRVVMLSSIICQRKWQWEEREKLFTHKLGFWQVTIFFTKKRILSSGS
jgi:hypothetical protein